MIKIKKAEDSNAEVIALLGTLTYAESHGHYIKNKNDLKEFLKTTFSVSKTKKEIANHNNIFYIISIDDLPIGYAKLICNPIQKSVTSKNNCKLDRIYILNDYIPLKIGQQFLTFLEEKIKIMGLDTIWLTVYIENERAIRFYQKNEYKNIGITKFVVNGTEYKNLVFSKTI